MQHAPKIHAGILSVLAALWPIPCTSAQDPSVLCDQAAARAATKNDVPIDILLAITRVETGRGGGSSSPWPWTINADGQGKWYETKADAVAAATEHLTDGTGTFDVGCFQLNKRWHGENFGDLTEMFDPDQNADYAARFLAELYQESGDWGKAVAAYHSRTPDRAEAYLGKVKAVLNDPSGTPEPVPVEIAAPSRENFFPLLQAGAKGGMGSLVPLVSGRSPLFIGNP